MGKPRLYSTEAIILRRTDLGEADRIVTIYTPQLGKVKVVAKGVRKTTSRLAGHVELFSHSTLLLARGQNLDILTQAQTIESFLPIRDDLLRTGFALNVVEFVERFTEERIENYPLFRLLADTLSRLSQGGSSEIALILFEMGILEHVGYRPELHTCVACRANLTPVTNFFGPGAGGVLCPSCARDVEITRPLSVKTLKVLRFLQASGYDEAHRLKLDDPLKLEIDSILRSYIRYLLERDMNSNQFLDLLRKQSEIGSP
ncbi:MAG: DNA repair protein RecO [Dehalococcoidia bacterium]|nr:DNA repair protein RecO [Dehalococcoidia bacterium]